MGAKRTGSKPGHPDLGCAAAATRGPAACLVAASRARAPVRRRGIAVASALTRIRARRTATIPATQLRGILITARLTRRRRTPVSRHAPLTRGTARTRRGSACRMPSGTAVAGICVFARGARAASVAARGTRVTSAATRAGASPVAPRPAVGIRGRPLAAVVAGRTLGAVAFATGALIRVITTGARVASATTVAAAALIAVGILVIGHVVSVRSGMRARRYLLASLNSRRKPENMPLVLPSCSPTTRAAF